VSTAVTANGHKSDVSRSSPKFPLTMEKKCAFAWGMVRRAGVLLTTPAV
jgi:hypothetical protein